jgi:hypothetical protein
MMTITKRQMHKISAMPIGPPVVISDGRWAQGQTTLPDGAIGHVLGMTVDERLGLRVEVRRLDGEKVLAPIDEVTPLNETVNFLDQVRL